MVQLSQQRKFDLSLRRACMDWSAGVRRAVLLPPAFSPCRTDTLPSASDGGSQGIRGCSQVPAFSGETVLD